MKNNFLTLIIIFTALIPACRKNELTQVKTEIIAGIKHIQNPVRPLKGTLALELAKVREIDPYEQPEVGLNHVLFSRSKAGEVLLSDGNEVEAHRFDPENNYLGSFLKEGQGPGEFQKYHGTRPLFREGKILVTSVVKMAWFDLDGNFIHERKLLNSYPEVLINNSNYLTQKTIWEENTPKNRTMLINLPPDGLPEQGPVFFEVENNGMIYELENRRGFRDSWATPNVLYTYNSHSQKVLVADNAEYKIWIKNLEGTTVIVITRPYQPVKLSTDQKKELIKWEPGKEFKRWQLSVYPPTHAVLRDLKILPNGFLAAVHFVGFKKLAVDVFDQEGKYLYLWEVPEDFPIAEALFYDYGLATVEIRDDMPFYVEYSIKNIPEIFDPALQKK